MEQDQKQKLQQKIQKQLLNFQTAKLKNKEVISYRICGVGTKPLVLIHGNFSGQRNWDLFIPHIYNYFKIITLDLRGFGRSSYNAKLQSIPDLAEDVKLLFDQLKIRKAIVLGWSLGGGVAMSLAVKYPRIVEKVILMSAVSAKGFSLPQLEKKLQLQQQQGQQGQKEGDSTTTTASTTNNNNSKQTQQQQSSVANNNRAERGQVEKYFQQIFGPLQESKNKEMFESFLEMGLYNEKNKPKDKNEVAKLVEDSMMQRHYVDATVALYFFDIAQNVKNITCPVLIYHGQLDKLIPVQNAHDNAAFIGKEKCTVVIKNEGTHSPILDDPVDFAQTIIKFSQGQLKAGDLPKPKL